MKDDPAFPQPIVQAETNNGFSLANKKGLTKREYFAALALMGIQASPNSEESVENEAKEAVQLADALIKQLGDLK